MKLNAKICEKAQPRLKPYKLSDGAGLILEVMPNGSKLWRCRYRFGGGEKSLSLGAYPTVSLKDARLANLKAKQDVRNNIDPSAIKQKAKRRAVLNAKNTFEAVGREWHDRKKDQWEKRHGQNILSRLERDVFPMIGNTPIADLEAPDIAAVVKKIEERGAGEMASRALQNCGQIIRYAVQTGRAKYDATSGLKGFLKKRPKNHYGAIKVSELPVLVHKIRTNECRLFKQTRIALELMMLTFVRTSELINAKWDEFDLDARRWIIPAARMKTRIEHIVPLATQTIGLLKELSEISGKREHVFPSIPRPRQPMSNATLLRALSRMGYHKTMTGHGFRAVAMEGIQEKLGYDFSVVDRQLAHQRKGAVNQAYDRGQFLEKRHEMMQEWADYIDRVATHEEARLRAIGTSKPGQKILALVPKNAADQTSQLRRRAGKSL